MSSCSSPLPPPAPCGTLSAEDHWMMMLLFLLSLLSPSTSQISEEPWIINVTAASSALLPCGKAVLPWRLHWQKETDNGAWVTLKINSKIQVLQFDSRSHQLLGNLSMIDCGKLFCRVDNHRRDVSQLPVKGGGLHSLTFDPRKKWFSCNASQNWSNLSWNQDSEEILKVTRGPGAQQLHTALIDEQLYLYIPFVRLEDAGLYRCSLKGKQRRVQLYVSQPADTTTHGFVTGFHIFVKDRYWIIVVVTLGYVGFCCGIIGCYVTWRQKRMARKKAAKARFFKVSTTRNLYTDSLNHLTDTVQKSPEVTYQNVTGIVSKECDVDCHSDNTFYLEPSEGGDSYLEPEAEGDSFSNGENYENPEPDIDQKEVSEDEENYENANEEIKDISEGSQSYEDMKGSIYRREESQDESGTQDEDADSYENMQTPLYARPNHSLTFLDKSPAEQPPPGGDDRRTSQSHNQPSAGQLQWKTGFNIKKENGDSYNLPEIYSS